MKTIEWDAEAAEESRVRAFYDEGDPRAAKGSGRYAEFRFKRGEDRPFGSGNYRGRYPGYQPDLYCSLLVRPIM